jgi:hypothetical protein
MHNKIVDLITKDLKIDIELNKSKGDLVTGEPVSILLYFAYLAKSKIALVLLAVGFFIVVDSSIPN